MANIPSYLCIAMGKIDYSPLESLTKELNEKVQNLKTGSLDLSDVNHLVSTAQEVYKRLVILEFRVHGEKNSAVNREKEPEVVEDEVEEEKASPMPELMFNMEDLSDNSEALEEKIEQEVKEEVEAVVEAAEAEIEEVIATPPLKEKAEAEVTDEKASSSIAEKFEKAPIKQISKAYSLNEKFQFMRVLTKNDSQNFSALVDKLDSAENLTQANQIFNHVVKEPDSEEDKEVYENFKELIARRHNS